jgi:L,D-transpeptidase ErfK/SrfK
MSLSSTKSVGIIVLSLMALVWCEFYLPLRESFSQDIVRVAMSMYRTRAEILKLQLQMPKLGPQIEGLSAVVKDLGEQFTSAFTNDLYIAINPPANRLSLRRGPNVLLDATISTGRNDTLRSRGRMWVFQTPRGIMKVLNKKKDPVWLKPDWAFLEKGESIPAWDSPLRREKGTLGAFMLDLGGGVMIHGTPMEHLLGRSVTHGCIRVGSADLKVLFDSVPIGTKVYIF